MFRSIAIPPLDGMLVNHRFTPSGMSPEPINTPGWRETKWSKVRCLMRRVRVEPRSSRSGVRGVNHYATHASKGGDGVFRRLRVVNSFWYEWCISQYQKTAASHSNMTSWYVWVCKVFHYGGIVGSRTHVRTYIVCSLNNRKFAEADTRYSCLWCSKRAFLLYEIYTI